MSELPTGWLEVEIGNLCDLVNGRAFKPQEWGKEGLPIIRIQNLNRPNAAFNFFNGELDPRHLIVTGQLLFAWSGTPGTSFGAHVWNGPAAALNQHIFKVEFDTDQLDKTFFRHAINQKLDELIGSAQGGVGLRHVTKGTFERTRITLPPLAEQKRIAQKLDALMAQVSTLKARIDAVPALLKRFRQSTLNAAVSGRLAATSKITSTSEETIQLNDRARPISVEELAHALEITGEQFPDQWSVYALEQLVDQERGIPYGIVQTGEHIDGGVPTVRCGDVKKLTVDTTCLKRVTSSIEANYQRTRLKGGEVLLAIRGSVGNTAVAPNSLAGSNISREVAMIPCTGDVDARFIALTLQSPRGQQQLAGKTRGVAQKGINLADVRRLPIALPPLTMQRQIVHCAEQLFALADQLEVKVDAAQKRIDALSPSLLARAFRGELEPQDPSDEPAGVLLERIRAQRAAAPKPKRGRKATAN